MSAKASTIPLATHRRDTWPDLRNVFTRDAHHNSFDRLGDKRPRLYQTRDCIPVGALNQPLRRPNPIIRPKPLPTRLASELNTATP
jgi:hypothetical protein